MDQTIILSTTPPRSLVAVGHGFELFETLNASWQDFALWARKKNVDDALAMGSIFRWECCRCGNSPRLHGRLLRGATDTPPVGEHPPITGIMYGF